MSASNTTQTILFLGATGGCGLSALRRSLAAGHTCVAMCRTPAKLEALLNADGEKPRGHLFLEQGNAHDVDALTRCLTRPSVSFSPASNALPTRIVDHVVFSIGGAFDFSKMTLDDPRVCKVGMTALLKALERCRAAGASGRPHIVAVSTTGLSKLGRDVPVLAMPFYHYVLKVPHKDKEGMERALWSSGERWTVVRASLLTDGPASKKKNPIRVSVEDPVAGHREGRAAIGLTISREDVGRWIFENIIQNQNDGDRKYSSRVATITY